MNVDPEAKRLAPEVEVAVRQIENFIAESTGQAPTPEELANALTRYFVLKEILDFVKMTRDPSNA